LRLVNLKAAAFPRRFHLAVKRHQLSGFEAITQVVAAKPDALERGWPLPGNQFENGEALGAEKSGIANFGDDRGHLSGAQLTNAAGIQPVFIAERRVIE